MVKIQLSGNWKIDSSVFDYLKKIEDSKKPILSVSDLEEIELLKKYRDNCKIALKNGMDAKKGKMAIKALNAKIKKIQNGGLN